jgi:RHS repeat-associated protein
VGGLLAVYDPSTINCQPSTNFASCDGNGNVMALVNAADGSLSAQYEYGPFGELISATGPMATANPLRFSTKYQDNDTGLIYYGRRYYSPSQGRFLNRDPIGEKGGLNIYANVGNNEINLIDPDGRGIVDCCKAAINLQIAQTKVNVRLLEIYVDIHGTGLDAEHIKSLGQALTQLNEAYRLFAQHCGGGAAAAAILAGAAFTMQTAAELLQELRQLPPIPL